MSELKRPRGRPPKYPPDQVRERLVQAGIETLMTHGVDSGLDAISLDTCIAQADVPRGMSYRIWKDTDDAPQDALRRDVVIALLNLPTATGLAATREKLVVELDRIVPLFESGDPDDRRRAVGELARVVGAFNHDALNSSAEWKLYNALRAAAITRADVDPEITLLLVRGEDRIIGRYGQLYEWLADQVGISLREGFTMEQFSAAAYGLNEGLSGRFTASYQREGIRRGSSEDEWTLFSIGLEALIHQFFDL